MQEPSDTYTFVCVLSLPFVAWVLSRPPVWRRVRARLDPVGAWLWQQVVVPEQPDERLLQRWALVRLESLRTDLERVRALVGDDDWMSATRQVGNRLAYERLRSDVRAAEVALATFVLVEEPAPAPMSASRFAFTASTSQPAVELIEFGPSGRRL